MFRMFKRQIGLSSRKSASSFSYKFFIPSSELITTVSNSKIASLAFPSNDKNTMRALFVLFSDVAISQICISFFHVLYLSLSNVGGEKYFEALVSFSSATNVRYKELRLQYSVYGETPFLFDLVPLSHKQVWLSLLFWSQQNTLSSREYQGR